MPPTAYDSVLEVIRTSRHVLGDISSATAPSVTEHPATLAAKKSAKSTTSKAKAKAKAKKKVKQKTVPTCTAKDLKTKASKRRKCRVVKVTPTATTPASTTRPSTPVVASPTGPIAAPPAATPTPDAFPTAPTPTAAPTDGLRTYTGPFGPAQAQRLLYRAGFGPKPGQVEALAALGVEGAVASLINPGTPAMVGPAPSGNFLVDGHLAPRDLYGHLHLDMLDRQIRSTDSLTERMTLVLHDWFAVGDAAAGYLLPDYIDLLRASWRGSFRDLLTAMTQNSAMLLFLNGIENHMGAPNENYARELMELYTLGADRNAYTETDVRQMARALTGFFHDFTDDKTKYDVALHDPGTKTVFAGTDHQVSGNLDWHDAVNAVVDHPLHPSFVVRKLWSYFIPTEPTAQTEAELEALYRSSGEQLQPLVQAILLHPDLHAGPTMVKPPVVYTSGMLRAIGRGIDTDAWAPQDSDAGQLLSQPPNVSGWNDKAWLNTSTHAARWQLVSEALRPGLASIASYKGKTETPDQALAGALWTLGNPILSDQHLALVRKIANNTYVPRSSGDTYGSSENFLAQRQNVLRQLICCAPDFQVS